MRAAICGRNLEDLYPLLRDLPIEVDNNVPDVVISYGGDGALLGAERTYPGIPKCPIRDSRTTPKCRIHGEEAILKQLVDGKLPITRLTKIKATKDGEKRAVGLNDIVINRLIVSSAVRYRIWLDDELYAHPIVGDGLVVSTPFGSTGYYRSITHSLFRLGIGLAFNNSTEPINHLVIEESSCIRVEILRGPAMLVADNDPEYTDLETGDYVDILQADEQATILGLDVFRCPDCHWLRHHQDKLQ
ncbi:MAG: hypothetical protein K9N51_04070 [Candidatus Pacebacteria bacterium]|nr:hypothetical protein [Candidatus Paceibacterota bacterium]